MVAALSALSSCTVEYPYPEVLPDPVFDQNGFQKLTTISIYDSQKDTVTLSRIYGVSQQVDVVLSIDETLIEEYNSIYSASYTLMPAEYYEIPETITFGVYEKTAEMPVSIAVSRLVKDKGIEAAAKMLIPVRMSSASVDIEDAGDLGYILLTLDIDTPEIKVQLPVEPEKLEFISAIPLKQSITIAADANFTTLEPSKLSYVSDEKYVAAFNEANGTSYKFLPLDRFEVKEGVFDKEAMVLTNEVVFDCASIGGEDAYICPLVLETEADYGITQVEPVYVIIEMSELRIWLPEAGTDPVTNSAEGFIEFQMNSPMLDAQNLNLNYDPAKVADYNTEHNTSYTAMDASKVAVTAAQIEAGAKTGQVAYTFDISELPYDSGDTLMVAFTIDDSVLAEGTVVDNSASTVYVKIYRTLSGVYTEYATESSFFARDKTAQGGNSDFQNVIYLADGKTMSGPAGSQKFVVESGYGQKYAVFYCVYLHLYFDIDWENELADKPGCYPLINMRDRVEGYDEITYNASYFDSVKEEFLFDFITLGWWGPGGGGGAALDDPNHLPGELWHTRLAERQ